MINITKEEAAYMRKKIPDIHIRRTVHKYYMEEVPRAVRLISNLRHSHSGESYPRNAYHKRNNNRTEYKKRRFAAHKNNG